MGIKGIDFINFSAKRLKLIMGRQSLKLYARTFSLNS